MSKKILHPKYDGTVLSLKHRAVVIRGYRKYEEEKQINKKNSFTNSSVNDLSKTENWKPGTEGCLLKSGTDGCLLKPGTDD